MAYEHSIRRYRNWYAKLLRLYPQPYRERFGEGMEQTFNDLCREYANEEQGLFSFALWTFVETFGGIIRENLNYNRMKNLSTKPALAATIGFLFAIPFLIMNFIIALRLEPFYSFIGSFPAIRNATLTPLVLLLLFPIGAYIAALPMLRKDTNGKRRMLVANSIVIVIMLAVFVVLFTALGEDFYRCDILGIKNCD